MMWAILAGWGFGACLVRDKCFALPDRSEASNLCLRYCKGSISAAWFGILVGRGSAALFTTASLDGGYPGKMLGMYFDAQAVLRSYDYGAARVFMEYRGLFFFNGEVTVGRKYHDHDWGREYGEDLPM
jgi:hypothetical protein